MGHVQALVAQICPYLVTKEKAEAAEPLLLLSALVQICPYFATKELAEAAEIVLMLSCSLLVQICPYFATKELAEAADIVFMPYNYVTSELGSTPDFVRNTILILDEAHNVCLLYTSPSPRD